MILPSFATTAPTIGLGDVHPQPFFASCKARRIYSLSFIVLPPKEKALNKNVQGKPKRHKEPLCKKESSRMQTHPRAASTSAEPCGLCAWYLLSSRLYCRLRRSPHVALPRAQARHVNKNRKSGLSSCTAEAGRTWHRLQRQDRPADDPAGLCTV